MQSVNGMRQQLSSKSSCPLTSYVAGSGRVKAVRLFLSEIWQRVLKTAPEALREIETELIR